MFSGVVKTLAFYPIFTILLVYQKNSIIDMMNGKKIPIALTPCLKAKCNRWRNGGCIHIRKVGK